LLFPAMRRASSMPSAGSAAAGRYGEHLRFTDRITLL